MQSQISRIKSTIRGKIIEKKEGYHTKLPSERVLSNLFNTTRITVKDALISLETEGVIYREKRRGWFVSPQRIRYNPLSKCHFKQMVTDQQRIAETRLINVRKELATDDLATHLSVYDDTELYVFERLRSIDERPVLMVENYLISSLFPNILTENLEDSLTSLYAQKYGYETYRSHFEVVPTAAPRHVAKALNLTEGYQVLRIFRVNYKQDGEIMDCEFEYWRPDAVMITVDSARGC